MAEDRDAVLLGHIVDAVGELREGQGALLTVLTRLVETGEAQTEMLTEILAAARQEPGASETAQQLAALIAAVQQNTAAIAVLTEQMAALPAELGAELADALGEDGGSPDED